MDGSIAPDAQRPPLPPALAGLLVSALQDPNATSDSLLLFADTADSVASRDEAAPMGIPRRDWREMAAIARLVAPAYAHRPLPCDAPRPRRSGSTPATTAWMAEVRFATLRTVHDVLSTCAGSDIAATLTADEMRAVLDAVGEGPVREAGLFPDVVRSAPSSTRIRIHPRGVRVLASALERAAAP